METVANFLVGAGKFSIGPDIDNLTEVGFTTDGLTISLEREYIDLEADQSIGILGKKKIRERCIIKTNIAEPTLVNLGIVWDSASQDESTLSFGGNSTVNEKYLRFVGKGPSDKVRTIDIYKAVSMEAGEHSYRKGEATIIPISFEAIIDMTKPVNQRYGKIIDV